MKDGARRRMIQLALMSSCLAVAFGTAALAQQSEKDLPPDPTGGIRALLAEARFDEAEARAEQLCDEIRLAHGESSLEYASSLDLLVTALLGGGRANEDRTETLAFEAIDIKERLELEDPGELVPSLINLGRLYYNRGQLRESRSYLEQGLQVGESAYGPRAASLIPILRNLGSTLKALGELEAAEEAYGREGELIAEHRGPDHIDVAANAYNSGWLLIDLGDFAEAERRFDQAREIVEASHGPESPRMAWVLLGLGSVYDFQGRYALAVATHERALAIAKTALGPEHPMVSSCETGIGAALMRMGDFEESQGALERSLILGERAYGPEHENTGRTLRSLGEVSFELGQYEEAARYLERAQEIYAGSGAEYLRLGAQVVMGRNLSEQGAHEQAIHLLQSALDEGELALPEHPDLIIWQVHLGDALLAAGQNREAAEAFEGALERAERLQVTEYQAYLEGVSKLAAAQARAGDAGSAFTTAVRAEDLSIDRARLLTASLPERQALRVAEERPSSMGLLMTLVEADPNREVIEAAWETVIRSRAAVLDELAFRQRLAAAGQLDDIVVAEYSAASRRLANLLVHSLSGGDSGRFQTLVASASKRREEAEKRLAQASLEFRLHEAEGDADLARVMVAIPDGTALVAYVLYPFDEAAAEPGTAQRRTELTSASWRYAAFVATGGGGPPRFVSLGPASEIDRWIRKWRGEIHRGLGTRDPRAEENYRVVAEELRKRVWDPVAAGLGGRVQVLVVPAGQLNLVNLAALPVAGSEYLVDHYSFHHLSAERDLVASSREEPGSGLLAVGGANFEDTKQFAALREPGIQVAEVSASAGGGELRGAAEGAPACEAFRDIHFAVLPGAEEEARAIAAHWQKEESEAGPALLLMKREASEARFKEEATGRQVLHIATHGFFLNGQCPTAGTGQRGIEGLSAQKDPALRPVSVAKKENPLKLSGLALAGANYRLSAAPDEDDGILTAEEIAAMDLSGVQWAVLSGCDTGVGEIQNGEGVFGLRRAFQTAGAETLIMSLWPVRDEPTADWMAALYEARLSEGADTITATTAASRSILEHRREQGITTHPALWAGFVASGGWR